MDDQSKKIWICMTDTRKLLHIKDIVIEEYQIKLSYLLLMKLCCFLLNVFQMSLPKINTQIPDCSGIFGHSSSNQESKINLSNYIRLILECI